MDGTCFGFSFDVVGKILLFLWGMVPLHLLALQFVNDKKNLILSMIFWIGVASIVTYIFSISKVSDPACRNIIIVP